MLCLQDTARDAAVIEQRARDAGIQLLTTEEKLQQLEQEFSQLREARVQQQQLLQQVQQVSAATWCTLGSYCLVSIAFLLCFQHW